MKNNIKYTVKILSFYLMIVANQIGNQCFSVPPTLLEVYETEESKWQQLINQERELYKQLENDFEILESNYNFLHEKNTDLETENTSLKKQLAQPTKERLNEDKRKSDESPSPFLKERVAALVKDLESERKKSSKLEDFISHLLNKSPKKWKVGPHWDQNNE